ncbi:MAG: Gfo/Idh/MocA family oxidoreductase [Gorillibacterium sp.]|nr:Gfo/Idh/MocA family oxidoreductase [Gorillibacterium sp.]
MKPIRIAIVGFGGIAKTHIIALKSIPVLKQSPFIPILDTLITRDPTGKAEHAQAMGFEHVSASLEEALQTRSIDMVDICTPNALHLKAVQAAAAAGKAIYCEKPLTENALHSLELTQAAKSAKVTQAALTFRYHPAVMRIREALRLQMIGEVLQCRISYRRSGYLDAARPISWRMQQEMSGAGAISDLGVHVLDLFRHWFGEIKEVTGQMNTFVKQRPESVASPVLTEMKVDDWALLHVETESGIKGIAEVSRIAWGSETFMIDVTGTKGSLVCDLERETTPRLKLLDGSSSVIPTPATFALLPEEKQTLGNAVDSHFGGLHHFLYRVVGEDRWEGLAPALTDCLRAEEWIDTIVNQTKRSNHS